MVVGRVCGPVMSQKAGPAGLPPFVAEPDLESTCARGHIDRVRAFQGCGDCQEAGKYIRLSHEQRKQTQNGFQRFEPRTKANVFGSRHVEATCLNTLRVLPPTKFVENPFRGFLT